MRQRATKLLGSSAGGVKWGGISLNNVPLRNLASVISLAGETIATNRINSLYNLTGAMSGTGLLRLQLVSGTTMSLRGVNTSTGGIIVDSGTLGGNGTITANYFGLGNVTVNAGATLSIPTWQSTYDGIFRLNGGTLSSTTSSINTGAMPAIALLENSQINISGTGQPVNLSAANRTVNIGGFILTLNCTNTAGTYLPGAFAGGGTVNKTGTGLLLLQGASTSTCNLNIQAGTVTCGVAGCLGTSGTITVSAGATLNLGGFYTASSLAPRLVNNGTVNA